MAPEPDSRLSAAVNAAEQVSENATATTLNGVAAQLWTALYHSATGKEDDEAVTTGDIERVVALSDKLDRNAKLIVAAVRSLSEMMDRSKLQNHEAEIIRFRPRRNRRAKMKAQ